MRRLTEIQRLDCVQLLPRLQTQRVHLVIVQIKRQRTALKPAVLLDIALLALDITGIFDADLDLLSRMTAGSSGRSASNGARSA